MFAIFFTDRRSEYLMNSSKILSDEVIYESTRELLSKDVCYQLLRMIHEFSLEKVIPRRYSHIRDRCEMDYLRTIAPESLPGDL
jgi:hypothetical protein